MPFGQYVSPKLTSRLVISTKTVPHRIRVIYWRTDTSRKTIWGPHAIEGTESDKKLLDFPFEAHPDGYNVNFKVEWFRDNAWRELGLSYRSSFNGSFTRFIYFNEHINIEISFPDPAPTQIRVLLEKMDIKLKQDPDYQREDEVFIEVSAHYPDIWNEMVHDMGSLRPGEHIYPNGGFLLFDGPINRDIFVYIYVKDDDTFGRNDYMGSTRIDVSDLDAIPKFMRDGENPLESTSSRTDSRAETRGIVRLTGRLGAEDCEYLLYIKAISYHPQFAPLTAGRFGPLMTFGAGVLGGALLYSLLKKWAKD